MLNINPKIKPRINQIVAAPVSLSNAFGLRNSIFSWRFRFSVSGIVILSTVLSPLTIYFLWVQDFHLHIQQKPSPAVPT